MEENLNQLEQQNGSYRHTVLWVVLAIVATALVVGLGVYAWQRVASEREMSDLRDEVETLRGQVQEMDASARDDASFLSVTDPSEVEKRFESYTNQEFGYSFSYPASWFLEEGGTSPRVINRLSPVEIKDFEIGSDNAPIHFGMYSKDRNVFLNSDGILDFGDIAYQIEASERSAPDSTMRVGGLLFQKYDLIDYGRYEGTSAGNVVLVVSPELVVNNQKLHLVFEWQEFPGNDRTIPNAREEFLEIISSIELRDVTLDTSDGLQTYRNDVYGFTLQIPDGWVVEEAAGVALFHDPQTHVAEEEIEKACADNDPATLCDPGQIIFGVEFKVDSSELQGVPVTLGSRQWHRLMPIGGLHSFVEYRMASSGGDTFVFTTIEGAQEDGLKKILGTFEFTS